MKEKIRVSLTFDDGPNLVTSPQVIELLRKYKIPASFFLIGNLINEETKKIVQEEIEAGCTIENHSWTHSDMTVFTKEQIENEIKMTSEKIKECTGGIEPEFFRPPFIKVNNIMGDAIQLPFVCGRGVEDWVPTVTAEERAENVCTHIRDGQVILLHDLEGNINTVKALEIIIPTLLEQGVTFMTIRDLFKDCKVNSHIKNMVWTYLYEPQDNIKIE